MIITNVRVVISPGPTEQVDDGVKEKILQMKDGLWDLPSQLFAREIRFVSGLEALVNEFNRTHHKK